MTTLEWKLVPKKPTDEMLTAMDECAKEGYDEPLYAGIASSVYMAAVDAAPTPPQREWQGMTDEDIEDACWTEVDRELRSFARAIEARLREKNS